MFTVMRALANVCPFIITFTPNVERGAASIRLSQARQIQLWKGFDQPSAIGQCRPSADIRQAMLLDGSLSLE
jgi:hypothetical protein